MNPGTVAVPALVLVLVVWLVLPAASANAAAGSPALISASGAPADLDTDAGDPVLAADRSSGRVLAVWRVRRLGDTSAAFARVLDARGTPLSPQFALPGLGLTTTALAADARPRGGWLVVAGVEGPSRSTRIVSVAISRGGAAGSPRNVSAAASFADSAVGTPGVAFDRRSGRGLIAWFRDASGRAVRSGGVYARPIGRSGRTTGPARVVFAAPRDARFVDGRMALGFSGRARRWVAVWQQVVGRRSANRLRTNLYARAIRSDGRPRGRAHALGLAGVGRPLLVPATRAARAVVVFGQESFEGVRRLKLVRLDARGAKLGGGTTTVGTVAEPLADTSPQILADAGADADAGSGRSTLYYAQPCEPVGHGSCPQFAPILSQRLDRRGAPTGPPVTVEPHAIGRTISVVATGARSALIAWEAAAAEGTPIFDDTAMRTIFPQKGEIAVAPLAR